MVWASNFMVIAAMVAQAPAPGPDVAIPDDAAGRRIHVGDTGIKCVKLPCPSRGVFLPGRAQNGGRPTLLLADHDGRMPPPPMIGDEADLAAIRTAWNARDCLAIEGRPISGEDDKPVLRVDRIVGPCRDEAG
jgi:hypothetical protein